MLWTKKIGESTMYDPLVAFFTGIAVGLVIGIVISAILTVISNKIEGGEQ